MMIIIIIIKLGMIRSCFVIVSRVAVVEVICDTIVWITFKHVRFVIFFVRARMLNTYDCDDHLNLRLM